MRPIKGANIIYTGYLEQGWVGAIITFDWGLTGFKNPQLLLLYRFDNIYNCNQSAIDIVDRLKRGKNAFIIITNANENGG